MATKKSKNEKLPIEKQTNLDSQPQLPITELSNELTKELDVVSIPEMLSSLSACDDQLFSGWEKYGNASIHSKEMIETLESVIDKMVPVCVRALRGDQGMTGAIQVGGCGTSGRLAFFLCQKYNAILEKGGSPPVFQYLIAGGDRALVAAVEQAEDVPALGKKDLLLDQSNTNNSESQPTPRVYFGISCGMSAAYVAGQLFHARKDDQYVCVTAIGFNPIELSKKAALSCGDTNTSYFDIIQEMSQEQAEHGKQSRSFVINPIVGPEGITGSTRMKGGTMTKILLDLIFFSSLMKALEVVRPSPSSPPTDTFCPSLSKLLKLYQEAVQEGYVALGLPEKKERESSGGQESQGEKALLLVKKALKRGGGEGGEEREGKVYYVADCFSTGVVGLIDASECPPTFGAKRDDFSCFVSGGFDTICLPSSSSLRTDTILNVNFSLLLEKAKNKQITSSDLLIILQQEPLSPLLEETISSIHSLSSPSIILIKNFQPSSPSTSSPSLLDTLCDASLHIQPPSSSSFPPPPPNAHLASLLMRGGVGDGVAEVSLKIVLNVLSTLGHVLIGKVAGNRMIDVAVSNNKLYYRAIRIVSDVGGVGEQKAEDCLLRSIYGVDEVSEEMLKESIAGRIAIAEKRKRVTPRAILLARKCQTVAEADTLLLAEPIVRKLL